MSKNVAILRRPSSSTLSQGQSHRRPPEVYERICASEPLPLYWPPEPPSLPRRVRVAVGEWQRQAGAACSIAAELGFGRISHSRRPLSLLFCRFWPPPGGFVPQFHWNQPIHKGNSISRYRTYQTAINPPNANAPTNDGTTFPSPASLPQRKTAKPAKNGVVIVNQFIVSMIPPIIGQSIIRSLTSTL